MVTFLNILHIHYTIDRRIAQFCLPMETKMKRGHLQYQHILLQFSTRIERNFRH